MTELAFDKFRYWLMSIDVITEPPILNLYDKLRHDNSVDLISLIDKDTPWGLENIPEVELTTKARTFPCMYIFVDSGFLDNRLIISIAEITKSMLDVRELNQSLSPLKKLQEDLLWEAYNPNLFGESTKSIFSNRIDKLYPHFNVVKCPLILYCEPISDSICDSSNPDYDSIYTWTNTVSGWNHMVASSAILVSAQFPPLKNGATLVNFEPIQTSDHQHFMIPIILRSLTRQIAACNIVDHWNKRFSELELNKREPSLIEFYTSSQIIDSYKQILNETTTYDHLNLSFINELLKIKEIDKSFSTNIGNMKNGYLHNELVSGGSLRKILVNELNSDIMKLEILVKRIGNKSKVLIKYSRALLDSRISISNLRMQRVIIFLTVMIGLLTLILTIESSFFQNLIANLMHYLSMFGGKP